MLNNTFFDYDKLGAFLQVWDEAVDLRLKYFVGGGLVMLSFGKPLRSVVACFES